MRPFLPFRGNGRKGEAMQLLLGEYSHHLYIQGAKDCVEVLREFGVIK